MLLISRRPQRLLTRIQLVLNFPQARRLHRLLILKINRSLLRRGQRRATVRQVELLVLLWVLRGRSIDLNFEPSLILH